MPALFPPEERPRRVVEQPAPGTTPSRGDQAMLEAAPGAELPATDRMQQAGVDSPASRSSHPGFRVRSRGSAGASIPSCSSTIARLRTRRARTSCCSPPEIPRDPISRISAGSPATRTWRCPSPTPSGRPIAPRSRPAGRSRSRGTTARGSRSRAGSPSTRTSSSTSPNRCATAPPPRSHSPPTRGSRASATPPSPSCRSSRSSSSRTAPSASSATTITRPTSTTCGMPITQPPRIPARATSTAIRPRAAGWG